MEYYEYPEYADIMELYIETLTGTIFELRVSPFETIISVKAKIQRLEGIPICQQHLIYRSIELEDDYCLQDYGIMPGTSLKLVLAMRGGPINTRRIPMEDPAIREMAEYMEANKEEIWEKLPGNRQVTLLVFREGDQLNFFRVVDRGDGTLTPLSESLSGASVHNPYEEEDDEKEVSSEQTKENDATMNKMKLLKAKMENLSISKKKPKVPRPPAGVRPKSSTRRRLPSAKKTNKRLNKNDPLPPVGALGPITITEPSALASTVEEEVLSSSPIACRTQSRSGPHIRNPPTDEAYHVESVHKSVQSANIYNLRSRSKSRLQDSSNESLDRTSIVGTSADGLTKTLRKGRILSGKKSNQASVDEPALTFERYHSPHPPSNPRPSDNLRSANYHRSFTNLTSNLPQKSVATAADEFRPSTSSLKSPPTLPANQDLKAVAAERMKLRTADARMMTELVNQANREGKINNIVRTGLRDAKTVRASSRSHSRMTSGAALSRSFNDSASLARSGHMERTITPEARSSLISAHSLRGRLSGGRDRIAVSPNHRLPPVPNATLSPKKKSSKRCSLCNKRTGLATSYQCRCGNNFCAAHRYAEAHSCAYDYKSEGRKLLEQSNPIVSAPKLPKI